MTRWGGRHRQRDSCGCWMFAADAKPKPTQPATRTTRNTTRLKKGPATRSRFACAPTCLSLDTTLAYQFNLDGYTAVSVAVVPDWLEGPRMHVRPEAR